MLTRRQLLTGTAAAAGLALACQRRSRTGRVVATTIAAAPGRDGAGVALRRSLGSRALPMLDPFLMLDEIHSAEPADYQAGFPTHPHRGFETVSYVLRGGFAHADSVGNRGLIADGGAQWMTAGRGIVHSEMPQPTATREVWGLQLWVNLPAARKMIAPRYQDLGAAAIPTIDVADARVRVVAGQVGRTRGPVDGIDVAPTMLDVTVAAGATFALALPGGHAACAYVLDGALALGATGAAVTAGQLAVLSPGDELRATSATGGRCLVLAAAPIGEPVARRGPFVMTTEAELDQAVADYRAGRLAT
jgi:redox-sensitive bicupin YhaK (pirin superfamily)